MENKVLIFLTSTFPYGNAETFIENEIGFLADCFTTIYILPVETDTTGPIREVPNNVFTYPPNRKKAFLWDVLFFLLKNREAATEFFRNLFTHPYRNKVLVRSLQEAISIRQVLENLVKDLAPCKVYLYSYWLNDAAMGIAMARVNAVKISRAHGWDIYTQRHLYNYLPLRPYLARKLNGIFSISENGLKELQKQTRATNIYLSRLGTLNNTTPAPFPLNTHKPLQILSIGNAIPLKRLHLIGEAIELLDPEQFQWTHWGEGPLLQELRTRFPFACFRGSIKNSDLKNELAKKAEHAILVNTSTSEGIPVSMMEAMSFGIPCLGTPVGGVPEIIMDGQNGFYLGLHPTPKEIAEQIESYYHLDRDIKRKTMQNAYEFWKTAYNATANYISFNRKAFDC